MYEGILGPSTKSFPPMFIIRVISKDGKELNEEEIDNIMENKQPVLRFENIEQYEELQPETEDRISFNFDSNGIVFNFKKI